jgi:hypothetical protein
MDSEAGSFPNIPPQLRKYVPLNILKQAGTGTTLLAALDSRFEPRHDIGQTRPTSSEVYRVSVSIESFRYWEPTFFPKDSVRPWIPLVSDTDCHSWNLQESLLMAISRTAILQRVSNW